jgi:hypothetical protein
MIFHTSARFTVVHLAKPNSVAELRSITGLTRRRLATGYRMAYACDGPTAADVEQHVLI